MLEALLQLAGRVHPMVLHLPIGLMAGLAALELVCLARGRKLDAFVRGTMAWLGAISAVVSAASGLMLAREVSYVGSTVQLHQWLGIAVAVLAVIAAVCAGIPRARKAYAGVLVVTMGVLVPTGHLGAGMTHGENFLFEPFERLSAKPKAAEPTTVVGGVDEQAVAPGDRAALGDGAAAVPTNSGAAGAAGELRPLTFAADVLWIFESRCVSCHGESKQKGGLALHTREAVDEGGELGPVLAAGEPEKSDLVQRLKLSLEHDDHMPPKSKPQLTDAEVALIERWVREGAK